MSFAESARSEMTLHIQSLIIWAAPLIPFWSGCDAPQTYVVLDNDYPPERADSFVIYEALWQAVSFQTPVPPGSSSDPEKTVPASVNTAYVVLAPGWDPAGAAPPTSFIVLQSRSGLGVHLNSTLHIPVNDTTFAGNCTQNSFLTRDQADFITQFVFASDFAGRTYDPATCQTIGGP